MYIIQSPYVPFGLFKWMVSWAEPQLLGWTFPTFGMKKCCNPPPSDFVSKESGSFLLLRLHWWRGEFVVRTKKCRFFPSSQFRGSFPASSLELSGVGNSFVWGWCFVSLELGTETNKSNKFLNHRKNDKNWLHHFRLRQFVRISGTYHRTVLGVS